MHCITFTHLYGKMRFRQITNSLIIVLLLCLPQSNQENRNGSVLFTQWQRAEQSKERWQALKELKGRRNNTKKSKLQMPLGWRPLACISYSTLEEAIIVVLDILIKISALKRSNKYSSAIIPHSYYFSK